MLRPRGARSQLFAADSKSALRTAPSLVLLDTSWRPERTWSACRYQTSIRAHCPNLVSRHPGTACRGLRLVGVGPPHDHIGGRLFARRQSATGQGLPKVARPDNSTLYAWPSHS